jgi:hypothetical protein
MNSLDCQGTSERIRGTNLEPGAKEKVERLYSFLFERRQGRERTGDKHQRDLGDSRRAQDRALSERDLHAGENLAELLAKREKGLAPPIQMSDALAAMVNCVSSVKRRRLEFREGASQPKAHDLTAMSDRVGLNLFERW